MIEELISYIPEKLLTKSGAVFYSGKSAFNKKTSLYILGLNPGGDPVKQKHETIQKHTDLVLNHLPNNWSAYRDESWAGATPGTWGMQPRVLHLLNQIGCSPDEVPASNLVFIRSQREKTITGNMADLAQICWGFHAQVIKKLKPKTILCFGKTSSKFVCNALQAETKVDDFIENNDRKWRSQVFVNTDGISVIEATHPSIADWTSQSSDPSCLVKRTL